jgi:hypothetical protein
MLDDHSVDYVENEHKFFDLGITNTASKRALPSPSYSPRFSLETTPTGLWLAEVAHKLVKCARLPSNWDGYGSPPVRLDTALFVLEVLSRVVQAKTPAPEVVPCSRGAVQLEWHENGIDLEIFFAAPYEGEIWFQNVASGASKSLDINGDLTDLKKLVETLSNR